MQSIKHESIQFINFFSLQMISFRKVLVMDVMNALLTVHCFSLQLLCCFFFSISSRTRKSDQFIIACRGR